MSFFSQQTKVVEIDADNRVTVRKLSYGQQQAAMSAAMTFQVQMAVGQAAQLTTGNLDPFRLKREELYAAIFGWEGPGFEGRPVTRDNIDALPPEVTALIQVAVDDLNTSTSDAEKKDSASTTNTESSMSAPA